MTTAQMIILLSGIPNTHKDQQKLNKSLWGAPPVVTRLVAKSHM